VAVGIEENIVMTSVRHALQLSEVELQVVDELVKARVNFIVIGGHAVVFHGQKRIVNDFDVWIEPSADNVSRLTAAVNRLGYSLLPDTLARLQQPQGQLTLGMWNTDVLSSLEGLDFSACFARAGEADASSRLVMVLSRADLITTKSGSKREKDLADVAMLNTNA
jgi:hypothetical protein